MWSRGPRDWNNFTRFAAQLVISSEDFHTVGSTFLSMAAAPRRLCGQNAADVRCVCVCVCLSSTGGAVDSVVDCRPLASDSNPEAAWICLCTHLIPLWSTWEDTLAGNGCDSFIGKSNTTINNSALASEKKMIQFIFSSPDIIDSSMVCGVFLIKQLCPVELNNIISNIFS